MFVSPISCFAGSLKVIKLACGIQFSAYISYITASLKDDWSRTSQFCGCIVSDLFHLRTQT